MSSAHAATQVFLSTVSDDFEKHGAPFPRLRSRLRFYLNRAQGIKAVVQEEFPQVQEPTLQKLDNLLLPCHTVIHLVGGKPGAQPAADELASYLAAHPDFLAAQPALRAALGDFSDVTYTQWEAFMALHYGRDLFVYASPDAAAQQSHLDRLKLASPKKYASHFKDSEDLVGQFIGDLHTFLPALAEAVKQRLSPPRFIHHAAEHFLGREPQLELLDRAWADGTNVLSIIAWGGVGKTALITEWVQTRFIEKQWKTDDGQPALDAYFDWTFYDQGTCSLADGTEARTGSVGDFFEQALVFFGDPDPNLPGKGRRLADLIRQQRSLIILDGLEPLQQPPGHPQAGRLLDPDLRDLLAALAQSNLGLCLITSRQALTDLHALRRTVHSEHELEDLPVAIAIRLLRQFQIKGTDQELANASEKFACHALSLTLLGRYLFDAHGGDIARIDRIRDLQRADILTREDRHRTAWRILETYESWLATAQADGNPKTLAVLRLTGLFDRTATADCLAALRAEPIIPGLTDAISGMADDEWNILLKRLERSHLIKLRDVSSGAATNFGSCWAIDAHPLIREYFAKQSQHTKPEAFKAAHFRLFDHLCEISDALPETLEKLQPLYQAVVHGCLSNRAKEAFKDVFMPRILRGYNKGGFHSTRRLGAVVSDLGVLGVFFEMKWTKISPEMPRTDQSWIMAFASFCLRSLGRLSEAGEPIVAALNMAEADQDWREAAIRSNSLCELQIALGQATSALTESKRAIDFADRAEDLDWRIATRTLAADAQIQLGMTVEAERMLFEAEKLHAEREPNSPFLYSLRGSRWSEHRTFHAERSAWHKLQAACTSDEMPSTCLAHLEDDCRKAMERFGYHLGLRERGGSHLAVGLEDLAGLRTRLFIQILFDDSQSSPCGRQNYAILNDAVRHLRKANALTHLPKALLTAAFYHGTLGENLEEAERLLEEAQQIAERGPMPLYLADVHLHRARLFGRIKAEERRMRFPDIDPKAELTEARRLIEKHGYWRRKEELEDADAAAVNW
jgi:tetratricopeptide (TPR) repeat protein